MDGAMLKSIKTTFAKASKECMVLVKCGCKQNCVCVVVVAWTQSSGRIYGINLTVQCVGCISFCVVSCYSTIKVLKNDCWNVPLQFTLFLTTALKKLIIISKEKYFFQSTFFIGTWNLWKCKFVPKVVLCFEMALCTRLLKPQSVTSLIN